jgi:hypothetical protein
MYHWLNCEEDDWHYHCACLPCQAVVYKVGISDLHWPLCEPCALDVLLNGEDADFEGFAFNASCQTKLEEVVNHYFERVERRKQIEP